MRAKLSYKSKRNIVIALIIMVLFAASVTTTYFFIKGNQDSSAAFTGNDSQTSENTPVQGSTEGENNPDGNGEVVVPNVNDNNSENPTTTPEENQTTTRPNTQIGQNGVTGNGTATTTQTTGNVPNREYVTERTEQETVLVGENYAVAWAPLSIEANTTTSGRSIVRPEITAVKTASKEDVKVGEELVYTITATNNGKEDGSVVVKDTIPAGTTFVEGSIKVNEENSTYTAEDLANGITIDVTKNGGASTVSFSVIINKKNNNENVKSIKNIAIVGEEETETVETKVANITTVKTSKGSKGTLHELDTITYKLTSTNNGDGKGTVKVADQVPAGTTLVGNVTLTEDDKEYTEQELNDGIDVTLLPGEEKTITFTVRVNPFRDEKVEIKNEVATQDGETITPGTTDVVVKQYASVSVNKVFVDKENVDKLRPETVKVGLFVNENEEPINTVELNAENDWKYTFEKLDKYNSENEELNNYSVKEIDVDENYNDTYKVTTTENSTKVEITNTLKYENVKTNLTVFKIWDDDSNKAGVRPESVEFELIADKVKTGVKLTANKDNTWAVVFEDVNKYKANGDEIAYTVAETSYSKYYIVEIGNNVNGTIKVTNHIDYSLIKTSVTVTKVWEDDNKKADVRPTTITFELLADGVTTGKKLEAKATNNWTVKFDNLNKYTADGKEIKYKVEEEQVKYYQVPQYSDIKDGKITVTNTIDEEAIKTTCKVRYYLENVNGEYIYTATRDVNVPVKFGDIITNYEEQDTQRVNLEANGYTFNHLVYGKNENNTSLKITTNENTNVIDIYYVRQTFDYKVEYYQNSLDSEPINTEISTNQYRFGTKIDEKTVESDLGLNWVNKYIAPGYQEGKVQGYITIEKDSENVIKVLYMPRTDLSYTVNYLEQGTNNKLAEPKTVDKQTFGTSVTEEAIDITGYSKVEPIEEKITIGAEENVINFYYTINTHKITYKIVGDYFTDNSYAEETYNYRATITPVAEPEAKEGYTFSGWSEIPETMPDEDVVVTGSYTINTHKITYKIVGDYFTNNSYAEETYNYGATITPVAEPEAKEGYTFSGWSEIPETMPDEDVVVTGSYTINTYTITYIIDGQYFVENPYASQEYTYGARVIRVDALHHDGYRFSGWSEEIPETMPAHNIVVRGQYTINAHKITYKIVGDYFTDDSYAEETYNYGAPVAPVAEPEAKEGYTFSGWSTIPTTMPDEDVVITGRYTINTHKITYKIVGDYFKNDSYAEETYNYGATITPVAEPEAKEGYTFSGWSTIPTTMPDRDWVVTGRYTKMPDPSLEFTKIALNSNKQKITEFVYTPNGNNSFYYRLKLENTVANSYPVAVAKQVVTDTLPEGIELDTSNTLPEGVTAATEKGRTTLTWTATNIGKGNNAKYVDIKVKANEQVFKAEEKTETNQTLFSDINPSVVGDANIGSIDDKNNTAGLFIRFAEPTSGNKGYIYAGNVKNVNVSSVPTKVGNYDDTKINSIVSDTSKNKDMFDAFITANNKGGTIYNCLNGKLPSRENIKTYLLDTYNITLKDTQIVLWYQVVEASGEKSRTRTYSLENTKTNTTTNYDVDMPACSYHIDGMIVDISSLRTIPAGTMVPVTNTANATIAINGATQATTATATVSFYYKNK